MDNNNLTKPILGKNKSPLLGGKFTNPLKLKSINPFQSKFQKNNKLKDFQIKLPYVRGIDTPNMENNYNFTSNINNIILEYFGPGASPTSGAAPIGGQTHIIHHPSHIAMLNRSSMGQKVVRQRPELPKMTPFHDPLKTKDGLPARWN